MDKLLQKHRESIKRIAGSHGVQSIRVFGSFARGEERGKTNSGSTKKAQTVSFVVPTVEEKGKVSSFGIESPSLFREKNRVLSYGFNAQFIEE